MNETLFLFLFCFDCLEYPLYHQYIKYLELYPLILNTFLIKKLNKRLNNHLLNIYICKKAFRRKTEREREIK
jgi:hypothetical protein